MKSAVIYYFSGTGNTEIVAKKLTEEFRKREYNVDIIRIEDVLKQNVKIDTSKYDLVGIGCQVIGFGTPRIVYDFIKHMPKEKSKNVFVFRTAGGVAPINYNTSNSMIKRLKGKGYGVFYERIFSISSNWINKFDEDITRKLYEATNKKVSIMCEEVIEERKRTLTTGVRQKIIMGLVRPMSSFSLRLVGKDLFVNKSCSNCGLCINNCPAGNIYEKRGKIKFKFTCNTCLRCVYACPQKAINFRFLNFIPVPGGYNIKSILEKPCNNSEVDNKKVPPFFNDYINNDSL
jgi:flavodoxin/Pyruvate/2-oxoacid:ferredoxin oxidoreductase delta subunit